MLMTKKLERLGKRAQNSHDSCQPPPTGQSAACAADDVHRSGNSLSHPLQNSVRMPVSKTAEIGCLQVCSSDQLGESGEKERAGAKKVKNRAEAGKEP